MKRSMPRRKVRFSQCRRTCLEMHVAATCPGTKSPATGCFWKSQWFWKRVPEDTGQQLFPHMGKGRMLWWFWHYRSRELCVFIVTLPFLLTNHLTNPCEVSWPIFKSGLILLLPLTDGFVKIRAAIMNAVKTWVLPGTGASPHSKSLQRSVGASSPAAMKECHNTKTALSHVFLNIKVEQPIHDIGMRVTTLANSAISALPARANKRNLSV